MSSNIRVQRICQQCGKDFEARTTVTKTCSDNCAKKLYKARKKTAKIEESNRETEVIKLQPLEDLKRKEFLTVREAAKLLNCSKQTMYTLINTNVVNSINLKQKKTIIMRSDIDKLFQSPKI